MSRCKNHCKYSTLQTTIANDAVSGNKSGSGVYIKYLFFTLLSIGVFSAPAAKAEYSATDATANTLILHSEASRFLAQASMGGTHDEITALASRIESIGTLPAFEEWIDQQLTLSRSGALEDQNRLMLKNDSFSYGRNGSIDHWAMTWWSQAIRSEDQLRHKMAFALSQIFVVSMNHWQGLYRSRYLQAVEYYDLLMDNAFATHRDLLHDVTYSQMMGSYLSHAQNYSNPELGIFADENYAREIMQLFSMGVFEQNAWGDTVTDSDGNPRENYDNDDIREFAEVFTGLSVNDHRGYFNKNLTLLGNGPMRMNNTYHDQTQKTLLRGTVLPAGQDGDTDISMALDNLAEHSGTAPYMARLLIQRFTHSSPSRDYIKRVTDAWYGNGPYGNGVVGDFKAVLKAILLDSAVRDAVTYEKVPTGNQFVVRVNTAEVSDGKVKEPILRMTQFYRLAAPVSTSVDNHLRLIASSRAAGQEILFATTVFNFYDASFLPSDGPLGMFQEELDNQSTPLVLAAPELQHLSENVVPEFQQFYNLPLLGRADYYDGPAGRITTTLTNINDLKNSELSDEELIRYLDVMLCHGQLPYELAVRYESVLGRNENQLNSSGETSDDKFAQFVSVLYTSPACSVIM